MAFGASPNDRETDACAFEIRIGMESLERPEQGVCMGHIEPRAVIADEEDHARAVQLLGLTPIACVTG